MTEPFNPLAMPNLAHSIVTRMMETEPTALGNIPRFGGAGVYAIYYRGAFPAYELLSNANQDDWVAPIYVGKADPSGGRRGLDAAEQKVEPKLTARLRQHAASVRYATNLDIDDFVVRWLVVDDIWIALGESALIRERRPVWNALIDGFGNHTPGEARKSGIRSRWDTLHPGRPWAAGLQDRGETAAEIEQDIREYLRSRLQI